MGTEDNDGNDGDEGRNPENPNGHGNFNMHGGTCVVIIMNAP